jgi:hypothetical protein
MSLSELVAVARAAEAASTPADPVTSKRDLPLRLLRRSRSEANRAGLPRFVAFGLTMIAVLAVGFAGGMSAGFLVEDPAVKPVAGTSGDPRRLGSFADSAPAATSSHRAETAGERRRPQKNAMLQGFADYQRLQLAVTADEERSAPPAPPPDTVSQPGPEVVPEEPGAVSETPELRPPKPVGTATPRVTRKTERPARPPRQPYAPGRAWDAPGYTAR